jgi:DNA-binding winged helix-turn-helix (wHTH) protein
MDSPAQPHIILRFGSFELDAAAGELRETGTPRRLPAQPFRVLALLVDRAGELVTRQQIRQCLWGDRKYVEVDRGINFCVSQIRSALRDPAETSKYIKTIPRRGYRFVAATKIALADHPASFIAASAPLPLEIEARGSAGSVLKSAGQQCASVPSAEAFRRNIKFSTSTILLLALMTVPGGERGLISPRPAALTGKDVIVVADFNNTTGDAVFDDTLARAHHRVEAVAILECATRCEGA